MYPASVAVAHFTRAETWVATLTGAWLLIRLLNDAFVRAERRSRAETLRTLAESRCPRCSSVYGMAAAEKAEQEYREMRARAREHHAGTSIRYRLTDFWTVRCPHCRGGWEYDPYARQMCDQRFTKEVDPQAEEIARQNNPAYVLPTGAEWGEATCPSCTARKSTWAHHRRWVCARCGEPLGEPPPQEEREGETEEGPCP